MTQNQSYLTVIANTAGLQPGAYTGTLSVTTNGAQASLPVTLTVYNGNTLTLSTNSLQFNGSTGGTPPPSQTVNITGNVPGIPFTVSVATATGGGWLSAAQTGTAVPASLVVSANPGNLAPGTYTGTITLTSDQSAPAVINVTLVVSGQPILVVIPNPISLLYQTGVNAAAPTSTVQVITTGAPLAYTGTVTYASCGNFFTVNGLAGTTPNALTVTANLAIIGTQQSCSGNILLTATTTGGIINIPVTFQASTQPLISVSPTYTTFNYSVGGALPPAQTFTVSNSGSTPLSYGLTTSAPWLALPATPPSGFTTSSFTVSLNSAALALMNPGTYQSSIIVTALGAGNSPLTIPVTLTISNNPLVTLTPSFLTFNYQTGGVIPSPLSVNVASTMSSVPFTISVPSTTGTQFISFNPASGTATTAATPLQITLVPAAVVNLAPGSYQNQLLVSAGGVNQTLTVNLNVSATPLVNVSPQQLMFTYAAGGNPPPQQTLTVSSTNGSNLPVTFSSNQSYLLVGGGTSTTPSTVTVAVVSGLAVGTYNASITVTSGTQTQIVPVVITVNTGIGLTVTPTSLSFSQAANGPAPASQTVTLGSSTGAALAYSASATTASGGNWLTINGSTAVVQGSAPGSFTVLANGAQLAPGTYTGSIVITAVGASNSSVTIPVTLTVTAQTLAASPTALTFTGAVQGAAPASQSINVTSTSGTAVSFTATATSSSGTFLTVTPATGTTPQAVTVSVNQNGLAAGSYTGTVTITSTAAGSVPLTVPVTFTVGTQVSPVLSQVINAASGATGPIAPGEIISLFGTNLGPITPALLTLNAQGNVGTTLGNVQVLFDGIAAPLTYVSGTQINAVVPYEVFGRATTSIVVNFNGATTAALQLNVVATAPGIFANNGAGQAASLNQNNSVNTAGTPAAKGSTVVLFATGEGQTSPLGVTGSVTGATLKKPTAPVTVTIGGIAATVAYAGSAPGLVSGVLQVNVVVPANAPSGASVPVVLTVGTASTQQNVTIAVQ